jgi:F-type H+-transporting ATPase subunit alpha
LNLEEDNVGVVLLGPSVGIKEGSIAKEHNVSPLKVGEQMVGRVVNTLGFPIDGKGPIGGDLYQMPWKEKLQELFRQPVTEPLQTGIKAVDAIPVGRGQRELVIGDRQTGKSTVCIDTILNQKEFYDAGSLVYMLQLEKRQL